MTINVTDTVGANNTIVLDSNSKIPAIDGSQVTALSATAFTTGSLATARIDVGTTAGKILQLDGSARMPALSGTNLTNLPGPTVSTSDPAIDTNSTLGAKWINKTSGEVYICTDATTDENVWTNVGAGTGDIQAFQGWGSSYGYSMGGSPTTDIIDKWSFTTDGNATDVGNLTVARYAPGSAASSTHGFTAGGASTGHALNVIDYFPFASDTNASDHGDLTTPFYYPSGNSSTTYGYANLGYDAGGTKQNVIQKYPFASITNSTDVADATVLRVASAGTNSFTHGYTAGGADSYTNVIDKFSFSTDGNSTDVGDLTQAKGYYGGGSNSSTYGYAASGQKGSSPPYVNEIEKWAYASDANATDVGDILFVRANVGAASSQSYGYCMGGKNPPYNNIEKYSFTTDGNSTDVGDLTATKGSTCGTQI